MNRSLTTTLQLIASLGFLWIGYQACLAFYNIATIFGKSILPWRIALFSFCLFVFIALSITLFYIWLPEKCQKYFSFIVVLREKSPLMRYLLIILFLILPIYFFQYTHWGIQFSNGYIHLIVYLLGSFAVGILLTKSHQNIIITPTLLIGFLLCGAAYSIAVAFSWVSEYPLSLSWSEGNRLYDYSLLFGKHLYHYPYDKPLKANIDFGRQLLWGLPFILPNVKLWQVRFWDALCSTLPYLLFSLTLLYKPSRQSTTWLLLGLYGYVFFQQTDIYPTIIISALLTALAWQLGWKKGWGLLVIASIFASQSRSTWTLAPAIWAAALSIKDQLSLKQKLSYWWHIPFLLAFTGAFFPLFLFSKILNLSSTIFGSSNIFWGWLTLFILLLILYPLIIYLAKNQSWRDLIKNKLTIILLFLGGIIIFIVIGLPYIRANLNMVQSQPLYWNRLLPNSTHPMGLLIEFLLAACPLIILILYIYSKHQEKLSKLEVVTFLLPLLIFFIVGLIASVKAGGGNNLHNFDMFFIWLFWIFALAIKPYDTSSLVTILNHSTLVKTCCFLLVITPTIPSILAIRPLELHPEDKINNIIVRIQQEVEKAKHNGEILFMDQRQLLTFGYIKGVNLVPEYDKKYLMDKALEGDQSYFDSFYSDLAHHRFSLIITNPLRVQYSDEKETDYGFSEENDLWVKWIAEPVLTYYEPLETYGKGRRVQLLVPKKSP